MLAQSIVLTAANTPQQLFPNAQLLFGHVVLQAGASPVAIGTRSVQPYVIPANGALSLGQTGLLLELGQLWAQSATANATLAVLAV